MEQAPRLALVTAAVGLAGLAALAAAPVGQAHHYAPIQPGAELSDARTCTMGFVLEDPEGDSYVTTAGHCVHGAGQPARLPDGTAFGEVVFRVDASRELPDAARDLALIDVHDAFEAGVSPQVRGWGGPTGVAEPSPGTTTLHYGQGTAFDQTEPTRARVGHVAQEEAAGPEGDGPRAQARAQAAPIVPGDSGGPVLDARGRAVGLVTCICVGPAPDDDALGQGVYWGASAPAVLDALDAAGFDLALAEAGFHGSPTDAGAAHGHGERLVEHCLGDPLGRSGCLDHRSF